MTQRSRRAGFFSNKRTLSKYDSAVEDALKQKRIYSVTDGEDSTLTVLPDVIIADAITVATNVALPSGYFDEDKLVEVINSDSGDAVNVGTAGSLVACAFDKKTVLRFDGSAWVKIYQITLD